MKSLFELTLIRQEVLKSGILFGLPEMKKWNAARVDEIPSEILKRLGEKAIQEFCDIGKNMHEEEKWSDDFTRTAMIPLPKK